MQSDEPRQCTSLETDLHGCKAPSSWQGRDSVAQQDAHSVEGKFPFTDEEAHL